jgi:hypothetical protein
METIPMNHFRLFAHGEAFDPDAYLNTTALTFDGGWHKGESGHDHPKSSGVFKILGDGRTMSILEQEQIAIDYLSANRAGLQALAQAPGVTTFILGLQYQIALEEGTIGFAVSPSAPLMKLALEIGIAPTYYVMIDRGKGPEYEPGF